MASTNNKYHFRSISLPSRSHPTSLRVEEELNKLKTKQAVSASTSGSVCCIGLEDLYKAMSDLLNLSSTQELLFHFRNEKCLLELLDGSVRVLDLCGITRDVMLQFKEQIQALQSAFRRRKGDSIIESSIENYACFRKKMNKYAKKLITELKQMETKIDQQDEEDCHVIQLLKEVVLVSSWIFQSMLVFLSPSKPKKSSGWKVISKLKLMMMHRGAVACEEKQEIVNEIESADASLLLRERPNLEKIQIAQERLKELEMSIDDIEKWLEKQDPLF